MTFEFQTPNLQFESKRCWECGRWWAHEVSFQKSAPVCPFCAGNKIANADLQVGFAQREAIALKGVVTKLKQKIVNKS